MSDSPSDDPGDPDESSVTTAIDPAEAFSLLGNATRLEVVTTLRDSSVKTPLPFSRLYDRIDIDDSAQFNYHVQRLVPHFVSKTDDGYELTSAGRRIARAVAAGTYTQSSTLEPFQIDGTCYACGAASLRASYDEDELFRIECRDCDELILGVRAPPSLVRGRTPEAFVEAFDRWSQSQVTQAVRGLCPDCGGAVEPGVTTDTRETIQFDALARFRCVVCDRIVLTSFGGIAARHPTVESFHRERDQSLQNRPYWEIPQLIAGDHVEIVSREPWLIEVSFFADGDTCRVEIGEDLEVVETTIVAVEPPISDE